MSSGNYPSEEARERALAKVYDHMALAFFIFGLVAFLAVYVF